MKTRKRILEELWVEEQEIKEGTERIGNFFLKLESGRWTELGEVAGLALNFKR